MIQNTLYVFVHTLKNPGPVSISKMAYCTKLNDLSTRPNLVWEGIPDTPHMASIPVCFNNHLLSLGGKCQKNEIQGQFNIYILKNDESEKWKLLSENLRADGDTESIPSYQCACIQIPGDQEILVIGGLLNGKPQNTVYKVKIPGI